MCPTYVDDEAFLLTSQSQVLSWFSGLTLRVSGSHMGQTGEGLLSPLEKRCFSCLHTLCQLSTTVTGYAG